MIFASCAALELVSILLSGYLRITLLPHSNSFPDANSIVIIRYLVDPTAIFFVAYFLGKKVLLKKEYVRLSALLFASGLVGFYLGDVMTLLYDFGVGNEIGRDLVVPEIFLVPIGPEVVLAGVFVFFIGFAAVSLANLVVEKGTEGRPEGTSR